MAEAVDRLDPHEVLRALVAELALDAEAQGRAVLDLGCGFGWFCRWARGAGFAGRD